MPDVERIQQTEDYAILASTWHPIRNGTLLPSMVSHGSHRMVWWQCSKGHEWQASVKNRMHGQGCPYCAGKRVLPGENDLQTRYPELAHQWDRERNRDLQPSQVLCGSHRKVWWRCSKGHGWYAPVSDRVRGNGCPYCANKRVLPGYNDLQTHVPDLAVQWHPTKNGSAAPSHFTPGSNQKVWWQCPEGHEWQAAIVSRVQGSNCPKCGKNRKISFPEKAVVYYLKPFFPDLLENVNKAVFPWLGKMELDIYIPSLRLGIEYDGPQHIMETDRRKNTLCSRNGIRLIRIRDDRLPEDPEGSVNIRHRNQDDRSLEFIIREILQKISRLHPLSAELNVDIARDRIRILCLLGLSAKENALSSVLPAIAAEWDYTRNETLRPETIAPGSNRKVWWRCSKGHGWQATVVARQSGSGCPYCANKRVLPGFNDLASQAPELAAQWHPILNGSLKPADLTLHSGKKVWWQCQKGHVWQISADCRARGLNCPYCSNKRVLPGFNDLQTRNPLLAMQWHPVKNGELKASDVVPHCNRKVWWLCPQGHEWEALINNRARGVGCPVCYKIKIGKTPC